MSNYSNTSPSSTQGQGSDKFRMGEHIDKLTPAKGKNKYYCPVCNGNDLSVNLTTNAYTCYNGCDRKDIREAVAPWRDKQQEAKSVRPKADRTWTYTDNNGNEIARARRVDDGNGSRKIWQEYRVNGKWISGGKLDESVKEPLKKAVALYRCQEIQNAIAEGKTIFWVEGEVCADAMWKLGLPATTSIGGSGGLTTYGDYSKLLEGASLVICPDRDQTGVKYAEAVEAMYPTAKWLYAFPDSPVWNALPKDKGLDVADWIESGATAEQVVGAVEEKRQAAPEVVQSVWQCLDSNNYQIGKWESKRIAITEEAEIEKWRKLSQSTPDVKYSRKSTDAEGNEYENFKIFTPKCDFDFVCEKILSDSNGGGLMLEVSHVDNNHVVKKLVYIKSSETSQPSDFIKALKREFGRNLAFTLNPNELQALLQNRTAQYKKSGGKTYRMAECTGQQSDGTWVFENCQFKADGTPTSEDESLWVFNESLGETEKIPSPVIAPQDSDALRRLLEASEAFFHKDVFPKVLFTTGYSVATVKRQPVMEHNGCVPQLSLFGDPGSGKTTAAKIAASLTGMHSDKFVITKFSDSLIYEQLKSLGGLPVIIDDPIKKGERMAQTKDQVDNLLWSLYNSATRKVRGNEQTPYSNVIVTSNVALGEGNQATESRLLKLNFPVRPCNDLAMPQLQNAMRQASGGLSQLLSIPYDHDEIRDIRSRLLKFLSGTHARVSFTYALVVYFTQKLCDVAGYQFDAFEYCKNFLCPEAAGYESDVDSLSDFLEKLAQMKSENLVGQWNATTVNRGDKKFLAVYLPSVWSEFEKRFNPNYSKQSIQGLVKDKGGDSSKNAKFVSSKLEWLDYLKAKASFDRFCGDSQASYTDSPSTNEPRKPSKEAQRKAVMIPFDLIPEELTSSFDDYESLVMLEQVTEIQQADQGNSIVATEKPEKTEETEQGGLDMGKLLQQINGYTEESDDDDWGNDAVAPQIVEPAPVPDLPQNWQPQVNDRVIVAYMGQWRAGKIEAIPGQGTSGWKVTLDGLNKFTYAWDITQMRPLEVEVAAV